MHTFVFFFPRPWIWSRQGLDLRKQETDVCTIQTSPFTQLSFKLNYRVEVEPPAASGYPPAAVTLIHTRAVHGSRGDNVITMCQRLWQETDRLDAHFWAELWPVVAVLCLQEMAWQGCFGFFFSFFFQKRLDNIILRISQVIVNKWIKTNNLCSFFFKDF